MLVLEGLVSSELSASYVVLYVDYQEDRVGRVFAEYLVYLAVVGFERLSCGVPSDESLLLADLN